MNFKLPFQYLSFQINSSIYKKKVLTNFIIIGSIALIQMLNNILLGRILPKEDYGVYSFLFTSIVPLISFIVILGQDVSVVRFFSKKNFEYFKWKNYFINVLLFLFILIIILVLIINIFYDLSISNSIYLIISITSLISLFIICAFLRSKEKFVLSQLLKNNQPIVFLVFILILISIDKLNIHHVLLLKTIAFIGTTIIVIYFFFNKYKNGSKTIPKTIYYDGFLLWGIGLALHAVFMIDNFFIVKYFNYHAVAEYSMLLLFTRLYTFASTAIWSVYSQRFSTNYNPKFKIFITQILIVALLISFFYYLFGESILNILFKGKYNNADYLLLPFCLIGTLRLIHVYPACYFIGKSQTKTLKLVLGYNIIGIVFQIILLIMGLKYFGLIGAAFAGVITWLYRNIIGYLLIFKDT